MRYWMLLIFWPSFVIGQTYTGGLQSMRSPELIITKQDIVLNVDQVKVSYVYTNTSEHDITETLVFALPTAIQINQAPVQYQTIQRAVSATGRDISKELKTLGLPFNPVTAIHYIDASPNRDSIIAKLHTMQLIDPKEDTPTWTVSTYYYWQQQFPAKSSTLIEQTYKPNVTTRNVKIKTLASLLKLPVKIIKKAVNVAIHWTLEDDSAIETLQQQMEKYWPQVKQYCPTKQDYFALVDSYRHNPKNKPIIELKELNFAYDSNELWSSAVQNFNLTIESPKNMHPMLCWHDKLKHTANNTLQFSAENYVPQNISVLYVEK